MLTLLNVVFQFKCLMRFILACSANMVPEGFDSPQGQRSNLPVLFILLDSDLLVSLNKKQKTKNKVTNHTPRNAALFSAAG